VGAVARRGNAVPFEERLHEGLRALEPGRLRARPEAAQARPPERIADPGDERRLRTDDREVDAIRACELDEAAHVVRRDADVRHAWLQRGSGAARGDGD